ncbi:MAG: class I SAM-dependent methyltransferase [Methanobacterium paludis]|nr:class I SAM-dependent methyltransferase [Methanobacterium paludis]
MNKSGLYSFYNSVFPHPMEVFKKEISGFDKVLDVGCGDNSPIQYCNIPFSVGLDLFEPYIQRSKEKGIHDQYVKSDIRYANFEPDSFDLVICMDVIEHLTKKESLILMENMDMWAKKKVIVYTTNGYVSQDEYDSNPLQKHRSGWTVPELRNLGYNIYGMYGWKMLRGHKSQPRYRPHMAFRILSDITQKITYRIPNYAFGLLSVKEINDAEKNH